MIRGIPHMRTCKIVTNTSDKYKDKHPLSGDGIIQKYEFKEGELKYEKKKIVMNGIGKGINERSIYPIKNFSNTSTVIHKNSIYSLYDYSKYLKHDEDLDGYVKGLHKCGVHMRKYNNYKEQFKRPTKQSTRRRTLKKYKKV